MITRKMKGTLIAVLTAFCCFMTSFGNVQAVAPDEVAVPVKVELSGEVPEEAEDFVIKMKAMDEYSPMPAEGTVDGVYTLTVKGGVNTLLPKVEYKKLGIYTYQIWQEAGTDERCIYDDSVYKLTVSVINAESGEGYEAVVALNKEGQEEKPSEIIFENIYRTSAEVTLTAEKFLDEKTPKAEAFEFVLEDEAGNEIQTVKNDAEGAVVFDTLRFNQSGEYSFTISEKEGSDKKIIYDETVYEATITVKPEGETYVTETVLTVDGEVYDGEIVFNNETIPAQPKTGDNANLTLWLLLAASALVTIIYVVRRRKEY